MSEDITDNREFIMYKPDAEYPMTSELIDKNIIPGNI